ncbi:hypothetical protein D3C81_1566410 [compost metagenome]
MAVDQAFHFLGRAVGAQAPGIDQVGIEVKLLGGAVQAVGQGAEQPALQDRFRFGGLFFGRCRVCSQQMGAQQAAEQQGGEVTQHWSTPWAGVSGAGLLKELIAGWWRKFEEVCQNDWRYRRQASSHRYCTRLGHCAVPAYINY